ncbi:MAG: MBL fold metallo-hydrolase [Acidobacteria bacterium]|nr:MBL fold metallo-hydrolase [Acidobacteriota bacterium]MBV9476938.1 MBL fold metallo-hydrolase [Acidobacteriota bacterium]
MLVAPLSSGSAGNAYWLESDGTAILVDAGLGPRETKKRLETVGREIEHLAAIVVTHEHYDHIRGAESLARKYQVPIYLTRGTLNASRIDAAETKTVVFDNDTSFTIGELQVHACKTIHDAADPACFVVEARDGTRVGIASDLGYVSQDVVRHLSGCDGLFFESNHDLDMLRTGTYPWSLKRRIMSRFGHLSNDDSVNAVQRLLGAELKTLCMIHLSQKNNHESIVRDMCTRLLRRTGASIDFAIAKQFEPTGVFDVARRRERKAPLGQMSLF